MDNHLNGHSHIKNLIQSDEWEFIEFTDLTNLINNREELENDLIQSYNSKYNKKVNIIRALDELRQFSLISELHSFNTHGETFITKEEYLKKY